MSEQHDIREHHQLTDDYRKALQRTAVVCDDQARLHYAHTFKAFGDETRLKIISFLSQAPACLCEMVDALGIANSTMTHHLKLLERGDVVIKRKKGKYTVYQLNDCPLISALFHLLEMKGVENK